LPTPTSRSWQIRILQHTQSNCGTTNIDGFITLQIDNKTTNEQQGRLRVSMLLMLMVVMLFLGVVVRCC
jgi:hypothetical protein